MAQDTQVITGKFLGASRIETVGKNNFTIRRFWIDITTNPEYPNTPEFQLKGDKVNLVDNLTPGQTIQVKYNLDGRKYDNTNIGGKKGVITNCNAWKIDVVQMQSAAVQPAPARPAAPAAPVAAMTGPGQYASAPAQTGSFPAPAPGDDDLPF